MEASAAPFNDAFRIPQSAALPPDLFDHLKQLILDSKREEFVIDDAWPEDQQALVAEIYEHVMTEEWLYVGPTAADLWRGYQQWPIWIRAANMLALSFKYPDRAIKEAAASLKLCPRESMAYLAMANAVYVEKPSTAEKWLELARLADTRLPVTPTAQISQYISWVKTRRTHLKL